MWNEQLTSSLSLTIKLYEVDKRENQDPDEIDKVPVQTRDLHMLGLIAAAIDGREHTTVVNHASSHMHAMEPSQNKKRGREQTGGKRYSCFRQAVRQQMRPFIGLAAQEHHPAEDSQAEELIEPRFVSFLNRRQRQNHPDAANDQQKRHEGGQINAENVFGYRPTTARMAQNSVADNQTAEGHSVAGKKQPHPELAPALGGQGRLLRLRPDVHHRLAHLKPSS